RTEATLFRLQMASSTATRSPLMPAALCTRAGLTATRWRGTSVPAETGRRPVLESKRQVEKSSAMVSVRCVTGLNALDLQQPFSVPLEHQFLFGFGAVQSLDLLDRFPITQIVRVIRPDHDVIRSG